MTFFELVLSRRAPAAPFGVLARASVALFLHGLRHPGRPASMCRLTGRVTPR